MADHTKNLLETPRAVGIPVDNCLHKSEEEFNPKESVETVLESPPLKFLSKEVSGDSPMFVPFSVVSETDGTQEESKEEQRNETQRNMEEQRNETFGESDDETQRNKTRVGRKRKSTEQGPPKKSVKWCPTDPPTPPHGHFWVPLSVGRPIRNKAVRRILHSHLYAMPKPDFEFNDVDHKDSPIGVTPRRKMSERVGGPIPKRLRFD